MFPIRFVSVEETTRAVWASTKVGEEEEEEKESAEEEEEKEEEG